MAGERDAQQPPASVEALPDNVAGRSEAHARARQRRPGHRRDRLAEPQPRRDEGLDPLTEGPLADRIEREQRADPLPAPVGSGASQGINVAGGSVDAPGPD